MSKRRKLKAGKPEAFAKASNIIEQEIEALNSRIKQLLKELECAISSSLSRSARVAAVIAKINDEGFDALLVLEATVGLSHQKEDVRLGNELVRTRAANSASRKPRRTACCGVMPVIRHEAGCGRISGAGWQ